MKSMRAALAVVLGCGLVFSQSPVNISGIVKSGTDPVEGATILLAGNPELYTVSGSDGTFTLSDVGIHTRYRGNNRFSFTRIHGNRLIVRTEHPIHLSLFNGQGRQIVAKTVSGLARSSESGFTLPALARGLYIFAITAGEYRATFTRLISNAEHFVIEREQPSVSPEATAAKKSSAADKVIAMKNGYLIGSVPITSTLAEDLEIPLEASTQFQPTSAPEHSGSMVRITAADCNFSMGQPVPIPMENPDDLWVVEQPVHTVSFSYDYYIDTTEITQYMFDSVMSDVWGEAYDQPSWSGNFGLGDDIPCYHVSQSDAVLFCNARSKLAGLDTVYSYTSITGNPGGLCELKGLSVDCSMDGYRLPTEAEWEYACRGGTVTDFYWNKNFRPYPANAADSAEISKHAVWRGNSAQLGNESPQFGVRVGCATKLPNSYGLYDMSGSLGEWVHIASPYTEDALADPQPDGPIDAINDIIDRGGNWGNAPVYLRSGCRPSYQYDYAYFFYGFRTVLKIR